MHGLGYHMAAFAEAFRSTMLSVGVGGLLVAAVTALLCWAWRVLRRDVGPKLARGWRRDRLSMLFAALTVGYLYMLGATKSVTVWDADEEIGLVDWETEPVYGPEYVDHYDEDHNPVLASNILSFAWHFYTTNSVAPTPIHFRPSSTNQWVSLMSATSGWDASVPYADGADGGTNRWTLVQSDYAAYTNAVDKLANMWYVGTNLPAIDVRVGDLLVLTRVEATSSSFKLFWEFDPAVDLASRRVGRPDGTEFTYESADIEVIISGVGQHGRVVVENVGPGTDRWLQVDGFMVGSLRQVRCELTFKSVTMQGGAQ